DRRFFGRTGEVLYLMFCRTQHNEALLALFQERLKNAEPTWNSIVRSLQPADEADRSEKPRANAFLPYVSHACFDLLAEDWSAILRLNIPGFDVFPHLVNLAGLHMVNYQLTVSRQLVGLEAPLRIVCEVV